MDSFNKTLRYSELFNIYQSLLSETQKEILSSYFVFDLSITEIAENRSTSRAAVEDAIKKGTRKLDELEESMNLLKKREIILKKTAILKDLAANDEAKQIINDIEKEIY